MSKILGNHHKILTWLIAINIAGDLLSIPFWAVLPTMANAQSQSTLNVSTSIAIVDAVIAAALFALAFFGVIRNKKWGAITAIGLTIAQRVVGLFMFQVNAGIVIMIIWTLLIIYFSYRETKKLQ